MYASFPNLSRSNIDASASEKLEFNVYKVQFGDGYQQRSAAGINNVRKVIDFTFTALSDDDADLIKNFLYQMKGSAEPFYFKFYKDIERLYTCESFSNTIDVENQNTVSMQLMEWF